MDKIVQDLNRLLYGVSVVVQIIFLGLYGFKIYQNYTRIVYLVIYSVLAALSIFGFIYYLVTYHHKNLKSILMTKRGIRLSKYLANAVMIIVVLVEFAQGQVSDLDIVISGVSFAVFAVEILVEVLRLFYERYAELLRVALSKDLEKFQSPKEQFMEHLAHFSAKVSGEKQEDPSKQEVYVEALAAQRQMSQKEKRKAHVEESKKRIQGNWRTIKGNLKKKLKSHSRPKTQPETSDEGGEKK